MIAASLTISTREKRINSILVNIKSYIAFAVHGSRTSPRTVCALTVHSFDELRTGSELDEGFFEFKRKSTVTVH
jgi:hypothetical protein